jgi:hypothetical protein
MGIDPMNNISNNNKNTLCSYIILTRPNRKSQSTVTAVGILQEFNSPTIISLGESFSQA